VTSWATEISPGALRSIPIINYPTEHSSTFENIYTAEGRIQIIHSVAASLDYHMIPEPWRDAPIVHLGPIAREVEPSLVRRFPNSLVGLTPQGWLRTWGPDGRIYPVEWPESSFMLQHASVAVLSIEDLAGDENRIDEYASASRILVITEGSSGARVYWNGDVRRFRPPAVTEVEATGAGDVFAAAYFMRLHNTQDPWEAARFANQIAAHSVTRIGLASIPTSGEVKESLLEVL
jgi:sugar/nucleoside kinase (ribokinase family)